MVRFGTSGNSHSFYEQGFSSSVDAPYWLAGLGLNAYEYQCSKGVNISRDKAVILGKNAKDNDIFLSIHAPYYINLANPDAAKRINSINYILETLKAADWMNAKRVVVHPGSCTGMVREEAFLIAKEGFRLLLGQMMELGFENIVICPETMGKINQLGTVEEIIDICTLDERLIPALDFGHIHARGLGVLNSVKEYMEIFDLVGNKLGQDRLNLFHCHFSRIEFTKGGEKKHWTFRDTQFGPDFEIFAEALAKRNLSPVIICESRGTMAEDAVEMKKIYEKFARGKINEVFNFERA